MSSRQLAIANRHPRLRLDRRTLVAAVKILDDHAGQFRGGCPPGELSIAFLTDAALAQLHGNFLSDPTITDVITFEAPSALGSAMHQGVAGEICVSVDAALRQTRSRSRSASHAATFAKELMLYVVHGWLHLAGYDDLQPAKKRVMRRAEARALQLLQTRGRIPRSTLSA